MGLDMHLSAELYISPYGDEKKPISDAVKAAIGYEGDLRVQKVTLKVGYWRKANHIHKWFVDNVQGGDDECEAHYVSREKLVELRNLCQEVLRDRQSAPNRLPTKNGFFFGSTDYDDGYFDDCAGTINIIDAALKLSPEWSFEYQSSW